jgi:hypothetical protein
MLGDSFWIPRNGQRAVLLLGIVAVIVLHESSIVGLMYDTTLVGGWLPVLIVYTLGYQILGIGITYAVYRMIPDPPEDITPDRTTA